MNSSYEVEYCNLELRFDRRLIQRFITNLIEEGYSLYWNENEQLFMIAIRSGRKLIKLKFERIEHRYKLVGNYSFRDAKLSELMEKLINDSKGHAVVKRFKDQQILIENIMFGEIIKTVEISGVEHKVIFQKQPAVTMEHVTDAIQSNRAVEREKSARLELDYELATLHELLETGSREQIERCIAKLKALRIELMRLESL